MVVIGEIGKDLEIGRRRRRRRRRRRHKEFPINRLVVVLVNLYVNLYGEEVRSLITLESSVWFRQSKNQ